MKLESPPGRTAIVNGEAYLFFSGYAYLGMHKVDGFNQLVLEGMERYGTIYPSSRISNTRLGLYEAFESALSSLTNMPETVSFSSGYAAAQALSAQLTPQDCHIAPGTHPALAGNLEVYKGDFENWSLHILALTENTRPRQIVLVADSVNIMESKINAFNFLENIGHEVEITCVIDDSHGIGIIGENGNGIISFLPRRNNIEYVLVYSLSKAFGIHGGAVSCSSGRALHLRKTPSYTGSTAINPSLTFAFIKARVFYAEQRLKLQRNIKEMVELTSTNNQVAHNNDLPIFVLPSSLDGSYFTERRVIISSFAYPFPGSPFVNRLIVTALHTSADLQATATLLNELGSGSHSLLHHT